jgi:DNA-directed RNA polymerase specialized sigma24 family protein
LTIRDFYAIVYLRSFKDIAKIAKELTMRKNNKSADVSHPSSNADVPLVSASFSPYDNDSEDVEQEIYDFPYFFVRTRSLCRGVSDADLQDIAQDSWISFSLKFTSGSIKKAKAYSLRVIHSKFMDYLRKEKQRSRIPTTSLSAYGENLDIELVAFSGRSSINPANQLDDHMEEMDFLDSLALALSKLPRRQRRAMVCTSLDKVGEPHLLKQALRRHRIDESEMCWPTNKEEKRVLQASVPAARRALAILMHIDLSQYNQKKRSLQLVSH